LALTLQAELLTWNQGIYNFGKGLPAQFKTIASMLINDVSHINLVHSKFGHALGAESILVIIKLCIWLLL
jgi:hypothetical protein